MPNRLMENNDLNILEFTDTKIIQQILSGNLALFQIIIRRYNPVLYKIGKTYGYNHQDIEDLMQETYMNVYQHLSGFENRSAFKTWIIRIMLNHCYHKTHKLSFKNEKATEFQEYNKSVFMFMTKNHSDTNKKVINKELSHVIEMAVDRLPDNYRMTFALRELAGLNVTETAGLLNTTETNVKARLSRAKMMLRSEIHKTYSREDVYEFNLIYCDKMVDVVMNSILNLNPKK